MNIPKNAKLIIEQLHQQGYEAYAVGGCVRDSLLGLTPHDWDICTSATPQETKACFAGYQTVDIGIRHGTVAVILDHEPYEVTTYRIDGDYLDNRHPSSVTFTTSLREDLARRDFTVNAIACDDSGRIADPFGGQRDLKNRLLRCVGDPDTRFNEDALRILRALRFASCYQFRIEAATAAAIHRNAHLLKNIAVERIASELVRLLCGVGVEEILNTYRDVVAVFLPELTDSFDFDQRNRHHCFDVYRHAVHSVSVVESDPILRLTMLFHDSGKPCVCTEDALGYRHFRGHQQVSAALAVQALRRLRFPTETVEACETLITYHDVRYNGKKSQIRRLLNKLGAENVRRLFSVQRADTLSQSDYLRTEKLRSLDTAREQCEEILQEEQCFSLRQLAVNGRDLIELGIPEGRRVGRILHLLLEDVMNEALPNEKAALLQAAKEYSEKGNL